MLTLKSKSKLSVQANPLRSVLSLNVPHRKKVRHPKFAHNQFYKPTYDVLLYPNVVATISTLPDICRALANIWRSISNRDIFFERKRGNLPTYFGTRYMCVKFCNIDASPSLLVAAAAAGKNVEYMPQDLTCTPYMRIRVDSLQVAAFIVARWCYRTGQHPTNIITLHQTKKGMVEDVTRTQLCCPFRLETIISNTQPISVALGAAATILCTPQPDKPEDVYNIPFVRSSQNIGENIASLRRKTETLCIDKVTNLVEDAKDCFENFVSNYERWFEKRFEALCNDYKNRYLSRMGMWRGVTYKCGKSVYASCRYNETTTFAQEDAEVANIISAKFACPDILDKYAVLNVRGAADLVATHKELLLIALDFAQHQTNNTPVEPIAKKNYVVSLDERIASLERLIKRTRCNKRPPLLKELERLKRQLHSTC